MSEKRILIAVADAEAREDYRKAFGEQWQVVLAPNGPTAATEMVKQPCDVLVADLDLPETDGTEFLNDTRKKYPKTILFILATEADKERVMKNVVGAHQFLTKPCDKATLKSAVERAMALDSWISNSKMRELVARIQTFPTVPTLYLEVLSALRSPNSTTEQVGAIIAKDMAMMTKLLQVLNSACFGLPRRISNPAEAVGILGFEAVKSMVMAIKLLNQYDKIKPVYFSIDRLWRHSTEVGRASKQLVLLQTNDSALAEAAFTAGLMHDIGKIVLAANFDEQYRGAQSLAAKQKLPGEEVEREIFGAGHGEIGAYLLGLWGMPLDLLEVAAYHHQPSRNPNRGFNLLTAVHVANALYYERHPDRDGAIVSKVDEAYLSENGLLERLPVWREGKEIKKTVSTAAKAEVKPAAKPAAEAAKPKPKVTMEVKPSPLAPPVQPKRTPAPPVPVPATADKVGPLTRQQWIYAGAAAAAVVVLVAWLAMSSGSKPASDDATVVRAREATSVQAPAPASPVVADNTASKPAPAAPAPAPAPVAKPAPQQLTFADLKLQGIFYSAKNPTAILSGKMVRPNDRIAGAVVTEIGQTSVKLIYQDQIKILKLR
jgi:HD-like signal output (HDOD) protein